LDAITLKEHDVLWFRATSKQLSEIKNTEGLRMMYRKGEDGKPSADAEDIKTVEAIIGPQSELVGKSVKQSNIRRRYGLVVAAVHRKGLALEEGYQNIPLAFGDTLLLEGPAHNILRMNQEGSFLSLNETFETSYRKSRMPLAIGILVGVVLAAAFDFLSISSAAIVGAVLVVVTGCLELRKAYGAIEWNVLFLIYGMLGVGLAMEKTGGAEWISLGVVNLMSQFGPLAILAAVYLLTAALTELITNNAVAILMTPIVISIATSMEVDARPFLVTVMFAASASFLTPIGYQTNTYVYGAGGYKFGDFIKVGLPLDLILWVVAILMIPRIWPF